MAKEERITLNVDDKKRIPVAKAPKYTPVKENQQYPSGPKGQLKAFHEHVWPKGFSPERRRAVSDVQFPVSGQSDTPNKLARAHIEETIARSTMPVEHMKQLKESGTAFSVREVNDSGNPTSSFEPANRKINLNVKPQDTGADVSHQLIHEVGHALDYSRDSQKMIKRLSEMSKPGADYGPLVPTGSNKGAHPVVEGIAEGYSAAHARISSAQKSTGGDVSKYGYNPYSWKSPMLGHQFINSRNKTYKEETGKRFEEFSETPPKQEPSTQMKLPGIE